MRLAYNNETKRYGLLNKMDLWEDDGLHCGQKLEVFINDKWVPDRLERTWDGTWYLVNNNEYYGTGDYRDSLEGIKVRIA